MSLEAGLTIIAVLLAPIIALRVSEKLNENKEATRRKLNIFTVLMETRGAGIVSAHVRALNRIDIEFYEDKKIIAKWREYQDHLSSSPDLGDKERWVLWVSQKDDKLNDMLQEMSESLNYKFDTVLIKKGHYFPQGYVDAENEKMIIRNGLVDIFTKQKPIPIFVCDQNNSKENQDKKEDDKEDETR